jgi:hypothetical protein
MSGILDRPLAVVNFVRLGTDPRFSRHSGTLSLDVGETVYPFSLGSVGPEPGINPRYRRKILVRVASFSKEAGEVTLICDRKIIRLTLNAASTIHHKCYGDFRITFTGTTTRRQLRAERIAGERGNAA